MSKPSTLSRRGQTAINQPLRADLDLFFEAMNNQFDAVENPEGKFLLCIAENLLSWSEMRSKLQEVAAGPIPDWVPGYTAILGAPPLRETAVEMLDRFLGAAGLNPEKLAIAAGAAAVIEMAALLLGDPEDVVVIPGPAYMAYTPDIANKAELRRYDLHPLSASGPSSVYQLSTADLDRAHEELGASFRVLLLTQPNNPTGQVYTEAQLNEFSEWCMRRQIHLVVNEIYALSRFDQTHPELLVDFPSPVAYQPFLPILEQRQSPYLHWWYAISKDFGLSGLRLGMAYTHNEELLKAWGNYGATSMTSNHTQWMLQELFADHDWVADFLEKSKQRLTQSYVLVIQTLRKCKVPYTPAVGSLFVWFDLSRYLTANTEVAEQELWLDIFHDTGLLLTAPNGMGSAQLGWFRLVYSGLSLAKLEVAMKRLANWLEAQE